MNAQSAFVQPVSDTVRTTLGTSINSTRDELLDAVDAAANIIYFTRGISPDSSEIWYGSLTATGAEMPSRAQFNMQGHNFVIAVLDSGKIALGNQRADQTEQGVSIHDPATNSVTAQHIEDFYNSSSSASYYMSRDRRILLLCIERDDTFGGHDIYISMRVAPDRWTAPRNIGAVVNSTSSELGPFLSTDGSSLYFSSKGLGGYGGYDVFVSNRLDTSWTNWSKPLNLGPIVNTTGDEMYYRASGNHAYYSSTMKGGLGGADIYLVGPPDTSDRFSTFVAPGDTIRLHEIQFEFGKWDLLSNSFAELERAYEHLQNNPSLQIEIAGHTDNIGGAKQNKLLSQRRADAVRDHLIGRGIKAERMISVGYGDVHPIDTNATEAGRERNRRVEFTILN